jgi:hypothetical protein
MLKKWRNLQAFDMKVAMLARGGVHEVTLQPAFSLMFAPSTCFRGSKIPRNVYGI